jgi:putative redox protein
MKHARVKWVEGSQFVGSAESNHAVVLDAGSASEGLVTAASPKELVLIGLACCTGADVASILHKMRVDFSSLEVKASAEEADHFPKVFTRIAVEYRITGQDIPEDKVTRAIELSKEKYCSVSAMLRKSAEIEYGFTIQAA